MLFLVFIHSFHKYLLSTNDVPSTALAYCDVMANFICQPDWVTGCPDINPNIFLGVSVQVFLNEINI